MSIKDEQLHTLDEQIEKLNENIHKQVVYIQTLIQENSRLNIKLLPKNAEKVNFGSDFGNSATIIPYN